MTYTSIVNIFNDFLPSPPLRPNPGSATGCLSVVYATGESKTSIMVGNIQYLNVQSNHEIKRAILTMKYDNNTHDKRKEFAV